jgi:hypothetical protein
MLAIRTRYLSWGDAARVASKHPLKFGYFPFRFPNQIFPGPSKQFLPLSFKFQLLESFHKKEGQWQKQIVCLQIGYHETLEPKLF